MSLEFLRRSLLTAAPVFFEGRLPSRAFRLSNTCPKEIFQVATDSNSGCGLIILQQSTELKQQQQRTYRSKDFNPLSLLPPHVDKKYLDFPFFNDLNTFRYINSKKSKVLIVMRGIPGSGKSTIVNLIKSSFQSSKLVVCSADDFFIGQDGSYHFKEKLLGVAHTNCQEKAKKACENNTPVVVIDNTNVRRWEMKFYLDLATTLGYVVVLIQPKTPWSMDPVELAVKNTHNVSIEAIQRKVKTFEDVIPSYYAWFCSEDKSASLLRLSIQLLKECLTAFPEFSQELLAMLGKVKSLDDDTIGMLGKYYIRHSRSGPLLHCTAKFCARGKVPGSTSYHERQDVSSACGRMFSILVPGLVFTRRTMGARVTLGIDAAPLFCKPEEKEWASPGKTLGFSPNAAATSTSTSKRKGKKSAIKAERKSRKKTKKSNGWECDDDEVKIREREGSEHDDFKQACHNGSTVLKGNPDCPLSSNDNSLSDSLLAQLVLNSVASKEAREVSGDKEAKLGKFSERPSNDHSLSDLFPSLVFEGANRSAHFTLRTAEGVESKEVNFDLLHTCDVEQELDKCGKPLIFVPVSHGHACYHGDGICCVYFDKPLVLKTIFSGHY